MNEYTVLCDDGTEITVYANSSQDAEDFAIQHGRRVAEVTQVQKSFRPNQIDKYQLSSADFA